MKNIIELNIDDKLYPKQLSVLDNPPQKLYAIGNLNLLNEELFSVVGTRNITKYGLKYGEKICKELVLRDIPLVSGLAIGTDTLVHKTCLKYGGKTIAVLPCGFDNIYPSRNKKLFEEIISESGLALTEYENNIKAEYNFFLARNRIVAALGVGTLIVEASHRSGTTVTANFAIKANKIVCAIPRKPWKYMFYWYK